MEEIHTRIYNSNKNRLHHWRFPGSPPEQTKPLQTIDTAVLSNLQQDNSDQATIYIIEVIKIQNEDPTPENFWFSTPKDPRDTRTAYTKTMAHPGRTKKLTRTRTTELTSDQKSNQTFLDKFNWADFHVSPEEKHVVEQILVEYHDIFAMTRNWTLTRIQSQTYTQTRESSVQSKHANVYQPKRRVNI